MLSKEEISEMVKNGPYITMQDVKLTMTKQKKDGQFSIPRALINKKMLNPENKYTLVIIRQN